MSYSKTRIIIYFFVFIWALMVISCSNPFKADLSNIEKFDVKIVRYEEALFQSSLSEERIAELQIKFPLFLGNAPLNAQQIIQLQNYVSDPFLQKLYDESQTEFPNLHSLETELSLAFRYIKYYFPSFENPQIYSYISGSQEAVFYQDQTAIIALDRYFGFGHEFYNMAGIPKYMQAKMKPEYMLRDVLEGIAKFYIVEPSPDESLLTHMIYHGKIMYFIKAMFPQISDEVLFAQTEFHLKWLQEKRQNLWRYYIENQLLFKSDYETYKKFISEAPFTSVLGDDSAPRTGRWLGYQIVYSYMKNNKTDLKNMIQKQGDQEFLNQSKYKP